MKPPQAGPTPLSNAPAAAAANRVREGHG
ncbi:MAG: hypothetical protein RLZZ560_258, partial [Cyanobacteriota bacterium]